MRLEMEQRMVAKKSRAAVLLQSWWKGWRCVVGGVRGGWWVGWRGGRRKGGGRWLLTHVLPSC